MTYFMSFKAGMETLPKACADYIGKDSIRLGATVTAVEPRGNGYAVILENGEALEADHVMLGASAYDSAEMVKGFDANLAGHMGAIQWSSSGTVTLAFKRADVKVRFAASGSSCQRLRTAGSMPRPTAPSSGPIARPMALSCFAPSWRRPPRGAGA